MAAGKTLAVSLAYASHGTPCHPIVRAKGDYFANTLHNTPDIWENDTVGEKGFIMSGDVTPDRLSAARSGGPAADGAEAVDHSGGYAPDATGSGADAGASPDGRIGSWVTRLPRIPLVFLGLSVYRAWIEVVFVGSFVGFPHGNIGSQNVFDATMVLTLLACTFFARRIGTLLNRSLAYFLCGILLLSSTALMFATLFYPSLASLLSLPAAVSGGMGIAIIILMWSEVYGCLNSLKVTYYYCVSLVCSALIIYLCRGLYAPWLFALCLVMPVSSLLCVLLAYRSFSVQETPIVPRSWFSVPWKPMLLMSVYGLAFGLRESGMYESGFGPHSSFGTLAVAVAIVVIILIQGQGFNINVIYRLALPLMVGAFLVLPTFGFLGETISGFCTNASYGAFSILTMIVLASMSYYNGISALWLFGMERGIRLLFTVLGRQINEYVGTLPFAGVDPQVIISACIILLVVTLSLILYSEKDISSRWGVSFMGDKEDAADKAVMKKQRLVASSSKIAREHRLTQREQEVLLLLAQKKSITEIEHELFIANGTAKAHVQNIYKKLSIHSREELFALFEPPA